MGGSLAAALDPVEDPSSDSVLGYGKVQMGQEETISLRYRLRKGGLRPQVNQVDAIQRTQRPRTKEEEHSFLELVGWN